MIRYTKSRASRKRKSAKSTPVASERDPLAVYDGQKLLGTFVEDEKSDLVLAWDADRKLLGRFANARAAARAISAAALAVEDRKAATEKALDWLNSPRVCQMILSVLGGGDDDRR